MKVLVVAPASCCGSLSVTVSLCSVNDKQCRVLWRVFRDWRSWPCCPFSFQIQWTKLKTSPICLVKNSSISVPLQNSSTLSFPCVLIQNKQTVAWLQQRPFTDILLLYFTIGCLSTVNIRPSLCTLSQWFDVYWFPPLCSSWIRSRWRWGRVKSLAPPTAPLLSLLPQARGQSAYPPMNPEPHHMSCITVDWSALAHLCVLPSQRVRLRWEGGGGHVGQNQLHHHQGAGSGLPRLLRALAASRQQPQPQVAAQWPPLYPCHRPKERRGTLSFTHYIPSSTIENTCAMLGLY